MALPPGPVLRTLPGSYQGVAGAWGHPFGTVGRLHSLTREEGHVATGMLAAAWWSCRTLTAHFCSWLMGSRVPAFFLWDEGL